MTDSSIIGPSIANNPKPCEWLESVLDAAFDLEEKFKLAAVKSAFDRIFDISTDNVPNFDFLLEFDWLVEQENESLSKSYIDSDGEELTLSPYYDTSISFAIEELLDHYISERTKKMPEPLEGVIQTMMSIDYHDLFDFEDASILPLVKEISQDHQVYDRTPEGRCEAMVSVSYLNTMQLNQEVDVNFLRTILNHAKKYGITVVHFHDGA